MDCPQLLQWEVVGPCLPQCGLQLGRINSSTLPQKELTNEFRELRATVERMGLMKSNPLFFLLYLLHILLLDVAAWLTLWVFGTSFVTFLLCAVLLSVVQVRAFDLSRARPFLASWGKLPTRQKTRNPPCRSEGTRGVDARREHSIVGDFSLLIGHMHIFVSLPVSLALLPRVPFFPWNLFSETSSSGSIAAQCARNPDPGFSTMLDSLPPPT